MHFGLAQLPLLFLTNTSIYVKTANVLICYFSFREAKKNVEASTNSSENRQTCSMQAPDSFEVEKSPANDHPLPEPRFPYPFTSCLSEKEQKTYLYLMTKFSRKRNHFQVNAASQREFFTYMVRYVHMNITKGVTFFFLTKNKGKGENPFSVQFVIISHRIHDE